jgi:hypothetical protein
MENSAVSDDEKKPDNTRQITSNVTFNVIKMGFFLQTESILKLL